MAKIDQVSNGESGSSARAKINEALKSVDSTSFDTTTDFYKRINSAQQTLTSAVNISMDLENGLNAYLSLSDNATLTLSNFVAGSEGNIIIDNTGSFTIAISPTPYVIDDGAGAITLTASGRDILSYYYDGTNLNITYGSNYTNV